MPDSKGLFDFSRFSSLFWVTLNITVVGGCGHVGLPLSFALAHSGNAVTVFDISAEALDLVNSDTAPFWEPLLEDGLSIALSTL